MGCNAICNGLLVSLISIVTKQYHKLIILQIEKIISQNLLFES